MNDPISEHSLNQMSCHDMTSGMVRCDEQAWTMFHQRYFDWLYATSLLRGSNHGEADDIVQLTFLRVVRHIKVFKNESDFKNWLNCLMRCVVIDRSRQVERRHVLVEKFTLWQELRKEDYHSSSTIDLEHLDNALDGLPSPDAQLIRLKYVDGWSTRELAERNSTTPKAIESKLARLRTQLRNQFNPPPSHDQ
jgi:RNA polymerase sigma factor (sigma-70 family)